MEQIIKQSRIGYYGTDCSQGNVVINGGKVINTMAGKNAIYLDGDNPYSFTMNGGTTDGKIEIRSGSEVTVRIAAVSTGGLSFNAFNGCTKFDAVVSSGFSGAYGASVSNFSEGLDMNISFEGCTLGTESTDGGLDVYSTVSSKTDVTLTNCALKSSDNAIYVRADSGNTSSPISVTMNGGSMTCTSVYNEAIRMLYGTNMNVTVNNVTGTSTGISNGVYLDAGTLTLNNFVFSAPNAEKGCSVCEGANLVLNGGSVTSGKYGVHSYNGNVTLSGTSINATRPLLSGTMKTTKTASALSLSL